MRFTVWARGSRKRAEYGFDPVVSFFVDVFEGGSDAPSATYSALDEGFDGRRALRGALEFMAEHGFFLLDDLDDAIALGGELEPEEMPARLRRVAEIVGDFRSASDV